MSDLAVERVLESCAGVTEPLFDTLEGQAGAPGDRGASRRARATAERLRQAVAVAEADRRLLAQGLPPADDPRWEGDPFGDGIVVEEYDERQFRLWALEDELTAAQQALAPRHGDPPPPVTATGLPDPDLVARRDAELLRPGDDA